MRFASLRAAGDSVTVQMSNLLYVVYEIASGLRPRSDGVT